MPRTKSPATDEFPIHIVARSNNRDWFAAPLDRCWRVFSESILEAKNKHKFQTHAFILMSNHYHWLLSTPEANLAEGMCLFQTTTSRKIARLTGRINRIYGARYKPTVITEPSHYAHTLRYIYQNPVRAGICSQVEDYPWSSLSNPLVPTAEREDFQEFLPAGEDRLIWFNTRIGDAASSAVRKALRRSFFKLPRSKAKHVLDPAKLL